VIRVNGDDDMALADLALTYAGENDCVVDSGPNPDELVCTYDNAGTGFTVAAGGTVNHTMTVDFAVGDNYDFNFEVLSLSGAPQRSYESFGPITSQVGDVELSVIGPTRAANVQGVGTDATYVLSLDNSNGGLTENLDVLVRVFGQDELACGALTLDVNLGAFVPACTAIAGPGANAGAIEFRYGPFTLADGATVVHNIAADFAGSDIFHFEFEVVTSGYSPPPSATSYSYDETVWDYTVAGEEQGGVNTFVIRSQLNTGFSHDDNVDNDYTRIDRAVQQLQNGDAIQLTGVFNWRTGPAYLDWAFGTNGVDDVEAAFPAIGDDWSISVPVRTGVTIRSAAACAATPPVSSANLTACGATILAPGDEVNVSGFARFLGFGGAGSYDNLVITGLRLEGFEIGLFLHSPSGSPQFNGLAISGNEFVVPADIADGTDELIVSGNEGFAFNRAIFAGSGNGTVSNNRIWLQAGGSAGVYGPGPYGTYYSGSRSIGIELQNSTNNNFNGFSISGNTITPEGVGAGELVGIWESAADCTSVINVAGNRFHGTGATATNGQFGLRLSSFGSTVQNNVITGAQAAVSWSPEVGNFCGGSAAVQVTANTLLDNGHGVRIDAAAHTAVSATLSNNRIVDNMVGLEDARTSPTGAVTANDNWWGNNTIPTGAIVGVAAPTSHLQLRLQASPTTIDSGAAIDSPADDSAITVDFVSTSAPTTTFSSFLALPAPSTPLYTDDNTRTLDAGTGNIDGAAAAAALAFASGTDSGTYTPTQQGVDAVTATVDNQTLSLDILTLVNAPTPTVTVISCTSQTTPTSCTPTDIDNDYTRINRAVQLLLPGSTLVLEGAFDWTEPFARADYAYGSNGIEEIGAPDTDDWSVTLPHAAGLNSITIRAATVGGASINAGNDVEKAFDPGQGLTSGQTRFLRTRDATIGSFSNAPDANTFHELTIENLELDGFDRAVSLAIGTNGFTYSNASYANNTFILYPDTDGASQFGLLTGYGTDQTVQGNSFTIDTGNSQQPSRYTGFVTWSGGASGQYDNLLIDGNTVTITGTPGVSPPRVVGLWENGEDANSSVQVTNNVVTGSSGVGTSHQIGLIVTTHSNGTNLVEVRGNTVTNAALGFTTQYEAFGHYVAAAGAQIVEGNDFYGNGVGARLRQGSGAPANAPATTLRLNRIVGNGVGVTVDAAAGPEIAAVATAEDNWWGCNAGPGATLPGCAASTNASAVAPTTWLRLHLRSDGLAQSGTNEAFDAALSADPTGANIAPADAGTIFQSGTGQDARRDAAFATSMGSVTTPVEFTAAVAANALVTNAPEDQGGALLTATYDSQTVFDRVRVAPSGCVTPGGPCTFLISPVTTPDVPSALDNDYTRIDNVVQVLATGDTVTLTGNFYWSEPFARADWRTGSDRVFDGGLDDYKSALPAGLSNVTITSGTGGAAIIGPNSPLAVAAGHVSAPEDVAEAEYDGAFSGWKGSYQDWSFTDLAFHGFDVPIEMFQDSTPVNFDRLNIADNEFHLPADAPNANEPGVYGGAQNIGVHLSFGVDQSVIDNHFFIDGSGAGGDDGASTVAIQNNTSGNNNYAGLNIANNDFIVQGVRDTATPTSLAGIWENDQSHLGGGANISITGNRYENLATGPVGEQEAIIFTSSSGSTASGRVFRIAGNEVRDASVGITSFHSAFYGYTPVPAGPVQIEGNTILGSSVAGVRFGSENGLVEAELRYNRIYDNAIGILDFAGALDVDTTYIHQADGNIVAHDNWWGCSAGPGSSTCGSPTVTVNGIDDGSTNAVVADTWLTLTASTDTPVVARGGLALLDAHANTNNALTDLSALTSFPACTELAYADNTSATLDAATRATGPAPVAPAPACSSAPSTARGLTENVLRNILTNTTVGVTLDAETVNVLVQVEDVLLDAEIPAAAAQNVTTEPFPVTVSNGSASAFSNLDVYFAVTFRADGSGVDAPVFPANLSIEFQSATDLGVCSGSGPFWCPLTLTNQSVTELTGQFPVGTLNAGQTITTPVRATFALDGVFSLDAVLIDDVAGITYAEDGGNVSVAGTDDVRLTLVSGSPQTAPVSTAYVVPAVARVADEIGNPLSGVTVSFNPAGSGAPNVGFGNVTDVSDADGEASSGTITANPSAGAVTTATVTLAAANCTVGPCSVNLNLTNTAAAPNSVTLAYSGPTSTIVASAFGAPDQFCATVRDVSSNPVLGVSVAFIAPSSGASATFVATTVLTNPSGVACTTASANTVAGTYDVHARVAGTTGSNAITLTNTAAAASQLVLVSGSGQTAPLNTAFGAPLLTRVTDMHGNPIAGHTVTFTANPAGNGASATFTAAPLTGANGETSVSPTANGLPGNYTVTATGAGLTPASVSFGLTNTAAAPADVALAVLSDGNAGSEATNADNEAVVGLPAGGLYNLSATVVDNASPTPNPVPGVSVTFVVEPNATTGAGTTVSNIVGTTDVNGVVNATFNANTAAGGFTVRAVVSGVSAPGATPDSATLTNLAGTAAQLIYLAGDNQTAPVSTAFATALEAIVADQFANPVAGETVTFTASTAGSGASATPSAASDVSDVNGVVSVTAMANAFAGSYTVTAAPSSFIDSEVFDLTNTAQPPTQLTLTVNTAASATATVDATAAYTFAATVLDASNNPVPGVSVAFSAPAGAMDPFNATALTNSSGVATFVADAGQTAGTFTVTAQVASSPSALTATVSVTNTADTDPTQVEIAFVAGESQTATVSNSGADFGIQPQVFVSDRFDNPLNGYAVTFTAAIAGNGATATPSPQTVNTDAQGLAATSSLGPNNLPGSYALTASLTVVACTTGTCSDSTTLTNTVDVPATVALSSVPTTAPVATASAYALSATVSDAQGNLLQGVSVTFVVENGANGAGASPSTTVASTNGSGVATATLGSNTVAGSFTVRAVVSGVADQTVTLTNTAAAASQLVLVSGSGQTAPLNTAFGAPLLTRVTDMHGNPIAGHTVTFTANPAGNGASATFTAAPLTGANGETSVSPTANGLPGNYTVTATGAGLTPASVSFGLTNTAAAPADVALAVLSDGNAGSEATNADNEAVVGLPAGGLYNLSATVVDNASPTPNPVPGVSVTFVVEPNATTGAGTTVSNIVGTTDVNGVVNATFNANTAAGGFTVRAVVSGVSAPGATPDSATLTNLAGTAAALQIVSGNNQSQVVSGTFSTPLVVRTVDAFGNVVTTPSTSVTFTAPLSGASATIIGSPDVTDTNGEASVTAVANAGAGSYQVTATATGLTSTSFNLTNTAGAIAISNIRWAVNGLTSIVFDGTDRVAEFDSSPTTPLGDCAVRYNAGTTLPNAAGSYVVGVTCANVNGSGSGTATLTIAQAASGVVVNGSASATYSGQPNPVVIAANPNNVALGVSYSGTTAAGAPYGPTSVPPTDAGTYTATVTVLDLNYSGGPFTQTITVAPKAVTVSFANLSHVYDGNVKSATATFSDGAAGTPVLTYVPASPTTAGSYTVTASLTNPNYTLSGDVDETLVIAKATAQITLSNLTQIFDDNPKPVLVTTAPPSLGVNVTYAGNPPPAPSAVGSYPVVATIVDANYQGTASDTLTILAAGVAQFVTCSSTTVNGTAGAPLATGDRPCVRVLDNNGNGVAGISILFNVTGGGGSATGTSATTAADGGATVASWTLGANAGVNTMTAQVNGLAGLPTHTFTANGAELAGVSMSKSSATTQAMPGDAITYSLVVTHAAGSSNAAAVDILDALPAQLDVGTATWLCAGTGGATCSVPNGTGDVDVTAAIPVGASITVTLTATVRLDATLGAMLNTATAELTSSTDPDTSNNTDDHSITLVPRPDGPCSVFCDGFEGDDIVKAMSADKALRAEQPITVTLPGLASGVTPLFEVLGTDAKAIATLDVLAVGEGRWFRLRHRDVQGQERFTAWSPLAADAVGFDWALDVDGVSMRSFAHGQVEQLSVPLESGQPLPQVLRVIGSRH
jgi:hypothetical protein